MEVTLKEASLLCRKSEKTLRRKIEAGLLEGRKEPLEFGGFMWLIDIESLEGLYPGSKPSQLPQVYNSPEPPQVRLRTRAIHDDSLEGLPITNAVGSDGSELSDDDDDDDEPWEIRPSFLNYILEENRGLKFEIKERDARILTLNERAMVLERALGEQEGKATTQARVLEWFQGQESEREKARSENEKKLLEAGPAPTSTAPQRASYLAGLVGAVATALLLLAFAASGLITLN